MVKKQTKKKFGQEGDGTRKQRWRVGDLLTNDRCSPAVLDFLRNYVGRAAPPVEETTRVTVRRRIWRGLRNERRGLGGGRESFESEGEGEKQAVMTVGLLVSCAPWFGLYHRPFSSRRTSTTAHHIKDISHNTFLLREEITRDSRYSLPSFVSSRLSPAPSSGVGTPLS